MFETMEELGGLKLIVPPVGVFEGGVVRNRGLDVTVGGIDTWVLDMVLGNIELRYILGMDDLGREREY